MNSGYEFPARRLEIRADKNSLILGICIYLVAGVVIPFLGFVGFGPGAAGDTSANGNSIWAFWIMRIILAAMWVSAIRGLIKSWRLLRELPILYALDETGITDRKQVLTPWIEFQSALYNRRVRTLFLDVRRNSQFKKLLLNESEIGSSGMEEVKNFMHLHAPEALTQDLK